MVDLQTNMEIDTDTSDAARLNGNGLYGFGIVQIRCMTNQIMVNRRMYKLIGAVTKHDIDVAQLQANR